jgi:hypothetical protein
VGRREEVRAVTDHGDVIGLSSSRHQAVVLRRLACAARRCWMYAPWASTAPQNRPPVRRAGPCLLVRAIGAPLPHLLCSFVRIRLGR